jgi:hypothetical protein
MDTPDVAVDGSGEPTSGPSVETSTCGEYGGRVGDGSGEVPRQHWDELSRDLKPVYTAGTEAAARERFGESEDKWAMKYSGIGRLWHMPGPGSPHSLIGMPDIRRVICSTDAIESPNCPLPARGAGTRPFPQCCRSAQMPLPRDQVPSSHRTAPGTMGHEVEAGFERIRGQNQPSHKPGQTHRYSDRPHC